MSKLLLTGRPRCGKSTLIQSELAAYKIHAKGFAVQRLTWHGETWAFRLLDLAEEAYITHLESSGDFDDIAIYMAAPGKWQGVTAVFENKGRRALEKCLEGRTLVIMDELGIFERHALAFQEAVIKVLDSQVPVLGVLKDKSNPFLDRVRRHPAVAVIKYPGDAAEQAVRTLLKEEIKNAGME